MPDPDRNAESERRTDPKYDNWPIEGYDNYTEWDVQRETPADRDALDDVADEYEAELDEEDRGVEWIGLSGRGGPLLYEPYGPALYEGEIDEENERVILRKANREELDEDESLGRRIEEHGEKHDWEWLSPFAREHLEGDGERAEGRPETIGPADSPEELSLRDSEFQQRNLLEEEEADVGFFGSHTLVNDDGWVHVVERQFDVDADDVTAGEVTVEIDEEFIVSEPESAGRRAGDADLIAERERELTVEAHPDEFGWENEVAEELEEWHDSHVEWPRET